MQFLDSFRSGGNLTPPRGNEALDDIRRRVARDPAGSECTQAVATVAGAPLSARHFRVSIRAGVSVSPRVSRFRICPGGAPSTMVKILAPGQLSGVEAQFHRSIDALGPTRPPTPRTPRGRRLFVLSAARASRVSKVCRVQWGGALGGQNGSPCTKDWRNLFGPELSAASYRFVLSKQSVGAIPTVSSDFPGSATNPCRRRLASAAGRPWFNRFRES